MADQYPTLSRLLDELGQMRQGGVLRGESRVRGGGKFAFGRGRDLGLLKWPGVGDYWLTAPQQEVVALLMEAFFETSVADVRIDTLLRAARNAGSQATKLCDVFAGSDAWGSLIVGGKSPGTYRLAAPADHRAMDDYDETNVNDPDEWYE